MARAQSRCAGQGASSYNRTAKLFPCFFFLFHSFIHSFCKTRNLVKAVELFLDFRSKGLDIVWVVRRKAVEEHFEEAWVDFVRVLASNPRGREKNRRVREFVCCLFAPLLCPCPCTGGEKSLAFGVFRTRQQAPARSSFPPTLILNPAGPTVCNAHSAARMKTLHICSISSSLRLRCCLEAEGHREEEHREARFSFVVLAPLSPLSPPSPPSPDFFIQKLFHGVFKPLGAGSQNGEKAKNQLAVLHPSVQAIRLQRVVIVAVTSSQAKFQAKVE